jgi:hypothetical protein
MLLKYISKEIGYQVKGKGEVRPKTGHEVPDGKERYSSTPLPRR